MKVLACEERSGQFPVMGWTNRCLQKLTMVSTERPRLFGREGRGLKRTSGERAEPGEERNSTHALSPCPSS